MSPRLAASPNLRDSRQRRKPSPRMLNVTFRMQTKFKNKEARSYPGPQALRTFGAPGSARSPQPPAPGCLTSPLEYSKKLKTKRLQVTQARRVSEPGSCRSKGDTSPQTPLHVHLSRRLCGVLHWMRLHETVQCLHSRENCFEVLAFHRFDI